MIDKIKGYSHDKDESNIDKKVLEEKFSAYESEYNKLLQKYLMSYENIDFTDLN